MDLTRVHPHARSLVAPAPRRGAARGIAAAVAALAALVRGQAGAEERGERKPGAGERDEGSGDGTGADRPTGAGGRAARRPGRRRSLRVRFQEGAEISVPAHGGVGSNVSCRPGERAIAGAVRMTGGNFTDCHLAEMFPLDDTTWHFGVSCGRGDEVVSGADYIPFVTCLSG